MADEVLRGQSYGLNADVFSIGIVVKQMMAGKQGRPQTLPKYKEERQLNPEISTINPNWPADVKKFLKECLSAQKSRPQEATELLSLSFISDERIAMYSAPTPGRARSRTITSSMWSEMQPRNKVFVPSVQLSPSRSWQQASIYPTILINRPVIIRS